MKSRILRIFLIFFILFLFKPSTSNATHASAMEFYFHWVSDSTYNFTLTFYRNCLGGTASAPPSFILTGTAPGTTASTVLSKLAISGTKVPPLKPNNLLGCAITNKLCFEEHVYRGKITLSKKSRNWIFTTSLCCTPVETDNVTSSSMQAFAGINNLDFPDSIAKNTSPVFHTRRPNIPGHLNDTIINYPIMTFCEMRKYLINQSAIEYNGDRVKYEFISSGGSFVSPYSITYPLPQDTLPAFEIDSVLGTIIYKPIPPIGTYGNIKLYLIVIKATEYRMDTDIIAGNPVPVEKEISFVMRNVFISTTDSANCPDLNVSFADSTDVHKAVTDIDISCDNNPIKIALTTPILCNSLDSNASNLVLINTITQDTINIIKSESKDCNYNNISSLFSIYLDSVLSGGDYRLLFVKGDDGNTLISECGLELAEFGDTLNINVTPALPTGVFAADSIDGNRDTLLVECREPTMIVYLTYPIRCSSLKKDGSDFYLVDSSGTTVVQVPFNKAFKTTCKNGYTKKIKLRFTQLIEPGNYKLYLVDGNDGNSLIDACYKKWPYMSINVVVPKLELDLGPDIELCSSDEFNITISAPPGYSYTWSNGGFNDSIVVSEFGTYWVTIFDSKGCTTTDTIKIIEKTCTGIDEIGTEGTLSIYPNPVYNILQIDYQGNQIIENIEILDNSGKIVLQIDYKQLGNGLDISGLSNGIYLINLKLSDKTSLQQRFVKTSW